MRAWCLRVKLWENVTLYKFLREISRILTIEGKRCVRYDNSTNHKGAFFMTILKKTVALLLCLCAVAGLFGCQNPQSRRLAVSLPR
jgi:hypothetical protein